MFILAAVHTFDCYWLTQRYHDDTATVLRYLRPHADDETYAILKTIKATDWDVMKTEALDPTEPRTWLDDAPLATELAWLKQHGHEYSWIKITGPDDLAAFLEAGV